MAVATARLLRSLGGPRLGLTVRSALARLTVDGNQLTPQSDWESVCWVSDDDVDYLELEIELDHGWKLQRQFLLAREDLFLFVADAIVGPLISSDWDIVDLGTTLESLGYSGNLYALTRPLPRAELVVREVGAACPGLTVHLLETA